MININNGINVISLFDGHSTGLLALDKANIKVNKYYCSEIEKYSEQISKNYFKNDNRIIRLGDITKINEDLLNKLPKIDLILSGSPCQNLSRAGNNEGLKGKESSLFYEFIRILYWIKNNNNPNINFLQENVQMKKCYENEISKCLGVKPIVINSKLVSAQNRKRLYWFNIDNFIYPKDKNIKLIDILEDVDISNYKYYKGIRIDPSIYKNAYKLIGRINNKLVITQATKKGWIEIKNGDGVNLQFPTSKTRRGRVINQKSSTLDCNCDICVFYNNILRKFTINELEKLQTLPIDYTCGVPYRSRIKSIGNGWTTDVIVEILKQFKFDTYK